MIAKILFWTTAAFLFIAIILFIRLKAEIKKSDNYKREAQTNADKVKEIERILDLKKKKRRKSGMKTKKKLTRKLLSFLMAMLLITLLTACVSDKVVYIDRPVYCDLYFPEFPILPDKVTRDKKAGTVTVPENWIVQLRMYQIQIEKTQKDYEGFKAIYKTEAE